MTALLLAVLALPAALAALLTAPGRAGRAARAAAPFAALPGLVPALGPGGEVEVGWLFLGARLGVDDTARVFLLLAALVWTAAGLSLGPTLDRLGPASTRFLVFALLAMSGTLGAAVSLDAISFYAFFATMTLAAYGVAVAIPTAFARRAGRVYIGMAVLGEALLLAGLAMAATAAGGVGLAEIRTALGDGEHDLALGLLLAGFGVKAGALGLHLWLPLVYAAAPIPGAAALAGVVTEIGLLGWLRTLPLGVADRPSLGAAVIAAGAAAAVYGVALGLTQRSAVIALGYSSVSQMGVMTTGVGIALADADLAGPAVAAVLLYALHHGLVKAGLFLGVGVLEASGAVVTRRLSLGLLLVGALSLAGAPLTSGGVAKEALKGPAVDWRPWAGWAIALGAAGTAVLMGRFLVLAEQRRDPERRGAGAGSWSALALLTAAGLAVVPAGPAWPPFGAVAGALPSASGALDALWPIGLGAVVAWMGWRAAAVRHRLGEVVAIPPGDVSVGAEWVSARAARLAGAAADVAARASLRARRVAGAVELEPAWRLIARAEARITAWTAAGVLLMTLIVVLAVTL